MSPRRLKKEARACRKLLVRGCGAAWVDVHSNNPNPAERPEAGLHPSGSVGPAVYVDVDFDVVVALEELLLRPRQKRLVPVAVDELVLLCAWTQAKLIARQVPAMQDRHFASLT